MKKVINGKVYDTTTAKVIGSYWNGVSSRDFNYMEEVLFKTAKGNYFLYGEGGPMTQYASTHGDNSWGWGETIIPLSRKEAFAWAQENLTGEEVQNEFPDLIEEA